MNASLKVFLSCGAGNSSAEKEDTMGEWYQRRTQKGMGRTEKTVHTGAAKNPRWLKACNITFEKCDMCEFFFISNVDEIVPKLFYNAKKDIFLKRRNILT